MIPACINRGGENSRIIVSDKLILNTPFEMAGAVRERLEAWNPRVGEAFTIGDGRGEEFRARILELHDESATLLPFERLARPTESPVQLEIYQALPQRERFDLILQKLTELGVYSIYPYVSRHSINQGEYDAKQKKSHRWPDILLKASKQCRRAMLPELSETLAWDAALYAARSADLRLFFYEGPSPWSLREALGGEKPRRAAVFIGPEGGFSREEFDEFRSLGFLPSSLGPRILRTESAAIAGTAVLQHVLGDLF